MPKKVGEGGRGGPRPKITKLVKRRVPRQQPCLTLQVRVAFADSLRVLWQVMTGIAGVGVLASAFMRGLPLSGAVDDKWGMEEDKKPGDVERAR